MATRTRTAKAEAPAAEFTAEAHVGRSVQLVDAVEDVLAAARVPMGGPGALGIEIGPAGVTLTGTAGPIHAARTLPLARTTRAGKVWVAPDEIARAIRSMWHEPVTLRLSNEGVEIEGSARISITRTVEPGAELPWSGSDGAASVAPSELWWALERSLPQASRDPARPVLASVCIRSTGAGAQMIATDSYRLSALELRSWSGDEAELVVDLEAASYLLRRFKRWSGSAGITWDEGWAYLSLVDPWSGATARVRMPRVQGAYPDVEQVIPDREPEGRLEIADVRAFAEIVASLDVDGPLALRLAPGEPARIRARAGAESRVVIETHVPASTWEGPEAELAVNGGYLGALARFAAGRTFARLSWFGDVKPLVLGSVKDGYRYLLMPVRTPAGA